MLYHLELASAEYSSVAFARPTPEDVLQLQIYLNACMRGVYAGILEESALTN
jgi:hypothetical protein